MKVLMINGSPRANSNTAIALKEMEQIFTQNGVETDCVQIGNMDISNHSKWILGYKQTKFDNI